MKKQHIYLLSIIILLFAGCKKEKELNESVYISDPDNPGLPAYSEWGYNTFGAYYDREAFISNDEIVPAKVIVSNNTTTFRLEGQKGSSIYFPDNRMTLSFRINGYLPATYSDLVVLNDTILDLVNSSIEVIVKMDTTEYVADILNGSLEFKRAQDLFVDQMKIEVILSGHFEFQALINNEPITVSDGRFDVGISPGNFYKF